MYSPTIMGIDGFVASATVGKRTPDTFHTTGLAEVAKVNFVRSWHRTTSRFVGRCVSEMDRRSSDGLPTHLELRKLESARNAVLILG